jgi:hypothetical protein
VKIVKRIRYKLRCQSWTPFFIFPIVCVFFKIVFFASKLRGKWSLEFESVLLCANLGYYTGLTRVYGLLTRYTPHFFYPTLFSHCEKEEEILLNRSPFFLFMNFIRCLLGITTEVVEPTPLMIMTQDPLSSSFDYDYRLHPYHGRSMKERSELYKFTDKEMLDLELDLYTGFEPFIDFCQNGDMQAVSKLVDEKSYPVGMFNFSQPSRQIRSATPHCNLLRRTN